MLKRPNSKKLALNSNTIRSLQSVDADGLRHVAGGESITGTCTDCNTYTKSDGTKVKWM